MSDPPSNGTSTSHPPSETDMKIPISSQRAAKLITNLTSVVSRISTASQKPSAPSNPKPVRLVAVSKLKPASDILALHYPPTSHLHFGENYVQELLEKSRLLPPSICWHFIGALQSNKCKSLARDVRGLWCVESVDSIKKATELDKGRGEREFKDEEKLRVFVQVNTSGEESKSGVDSDSTALLELARHIAHSCPHLKLQGLMTIGAIARSRATTPETQNEDFVRLNECRACVARLLEVEEGDLELSMGMSEDFEGAIAMGSNEVRVGSTIFGERPPRKDAKVLEDTAGDKKEEDGEG